MSWKSNHEKIRTANVLVIGAGGIGCELLKNLAATGFRKVHVIDLDTIDISNLNRQFLFRKEHVSSSKAEIATKVVKQFCPEINLTFDHNSIFEEKFHIEFFKKFDFVMNALDNKKARNHVNRMCHAARRPLIESGSAGYFGQVQVIIREQTECYECTEKQATQKTFPGCTIRNTPSEHIHCTVWAKHVFNQLFGEVDIDDDVSPDMKAEEERPEGDGASQEEKEKEQQEPSPVGTRQWAVNVDYDPSMVFDKLFLHDIEYLTKMEHLWKQRKAPTPLSFTSASDNGNEAALSYEEALKQDTSVWSLATAANVFVKCVKELHEKSKSQVIFSFDKDDQLDMAFVAACANIRAGIFNIEAKSMFEIKAMAGNIIPAIAATNAMVAGMMVTEAMKLVDGKLDKVRNIFIRNQPNPRGNVFLDEEPYPPNPKCYVCSETKEVFIYVNPAQMTVLGLCEKVLKNELHMVAPDVMDSSFRIIISSDGETDELLNKKLSEVSIEDGMILSCDDYKQDMVLKLFIRSGNELKGDEFKIELPGNAKAEVKETEEEENRKRKPDEETEKSDEPEAKRTRTEMIQVAAE